MELLSGRGSSATSAILDPSGDKAIREILRIPLSLKSATMLPKTALGRQILRRKLRVYPGAEHPHVAQQPTPLNFNKDET